MKKRRGGKKHPIMSDIFLPLQKLYNSGVKKETTCNNRLSWKLAWQDDETRFHLPWSVARCMVLASFYFTPPTSHGVKSIEMMEELCTCRQLFWCPCRHVLSTRVDSWLTLPLWLDAATWTMHRQETVGWNEQQEGEKFEIQPKTSSAEWPQGMHGTHKKATRN